jgi:hypothetical protein
MAITAKPSKASTPVVDVDALINKGGSVAAPGEQGREETEIKTVLLRVPIDILTSVDAQLKSRRPRVPRNTWILEAMLQRIEREGVGQ